MSEDQEPQPSNMRRFRRESDRKYLYMVIFTLVVVGGFLIALIFGIESLLTALPCLLGGAVLILLPWFVLTLLQRWRDGIETKARIEAEAVEDKNNNEGETDSVW
jgi:protein-S-isoprenylcysteine O-methyltransferase Ste14